MAASFSIATLFPDAAMRVSLVAEPLIWDAMDVNVSDCKGGGGKEEKEKRPLVSRPICLRERESRLAFQADGIRFVTYGVVNDVLGASIVIYVDGDAAQGCDFGGELFQPGVVLALALAQQEEEASSNGR
ncbi:hypothetical protein Trco_001929 [Trichoderma cornu-damae]|uniref:Uncharacterized protein n=1 Tax=Trichoderma cornu-damae TaxID=654480 RepID=A0A9P8QSS8_9HYPO|nr:hypothetical protein Trco_001929 [Trichoderma cornu-damae]